VAVIGHAVAVIMMCKVMFFGSGNRPSKNVGLLVIVIVGRHL
jgi:hypothetical protein